MSGSIKADSDSHVRLQWQGDDLSFVVISNGRYAREVVAGSLLDVRQRFGTGPVTEAMLEYAIAEIEELIMPVLRMLPGGGQLQVDGQEAMPVLVMLAPEGGAPSIENIERLFNELVDVAAGAPVVSRRVPMTASFMLALTLLREVMHHGGFDSASRFEPAS